ncbi:hypothetical protein A2160_02085 [Candidatus Beckwithbacteria bacterium RBG_13_42_9]|uniref:Methyltransferase domain-containing protein n=1 Tax=Candidatus Beckwithbacteria bacterium RBG_13_42_9 TaxID=1797457 RepID=A0A1F5E7B6_9BACT|nr:MAG: hypothetical protein A2160_02085 [Candidatus Beckwithbacteria bacterium RBG_13_42_9]
MKKVSSDKYTKDYFLSSCEGGKLWQRKKGTELTPRLQHAVSLVKIKPGDQVLDFGCGRGEIASYAAKKGATVLAVDYAPEALKLCRQTVKKLPPKISKRIKIIQANVESLEAAKNSFDLIFLIDVFEHLTNHELNLLLTKFYNSLKTGGTLLIHTAPNKQFYNIGFPFYTRWANLLISPFWKLIFHEEKIQLDSDPRAEHDHELHINEQTVESLKAWLNKTGYLSQVWLDSRFHAIRFRDKLNYALLTPIWIPGLSRFFTRDIWALGKK